MKKKNKKEKTETPEIEKTEEEKSEEKSKENKPKKTEKIFKAVGWGFDAYDLVMKNKVIVSVFLFIQGFHYITRPMRSLKGDAKTLALLTGLYALVGAIVMIVGENSKASKVKKGYEFVGGEFKNFFKGKKKVIKQSMERLPDNSFVEKSSQKVNSKIDTLKNKKKQNQDGFFLRHKWLLISTYFLLFAVCVPLYFFSKFTVVLVHIVLGAVIIADGVFTLLALYKTRKTVKLRDNVLTIILSIASILLGAALIIMLHTSTFLWLRIIGAGLVIKAVGEIWIYLRNRELIKSGKETYAKIKDLKNKDKEDTEEKEKDEPESEYNKESDEENIEESESEE